MYINKALCLYNLRCVIYPGKNIYMSMNFKNQQNHTIHRVPQSFYLIQDNILEICDQAVRHSLTNYLSFNAMYGNLQKTITLPDSSK